MASEVLVEQVVSRNPATGEIAFAGPATSRTGLDKALRRACEAAPTWDRTGVGERAAVLMRFAELVDRDASSLASSITAEVGKISADAEAEVEWTALSARWYAGHPPEEETVGSARVRPRPLGVVAAVTPWNVPLITPAWKWLPALVAGNAVVWKPSELATGTALRAEALLEEAGLPPGVLQVAPGSAETASTLVADARVAAVHFTGSTRAGQAVVAATSQRFARCALEMGGVNSAVVFADADLDLAAEAIVASATALNGQKCTATRRVLVDDSVANELTHRIAERVEELRMGDPAQPTTTLGPLIHAGARARAQQAVSGAVDRGAHVAARTPVDLSAGVVPDAFFPATVLGGLPPDDLLHVEEVFAPIIVLGTFTREEDAWSAADSTPYGLTAAVYTHDQARVTAAQRLTTGVLAINRRADAVELEPPFGGRRWSGNGFPEGGRYAYSAVTDLQAVYGGSAHRGLEGMGGASA